MIKDTTRGKMNTKFVTTIQKKYDYRVQKDNHKIEDSRYIKTNGVKTSASKECSRYNK